MGEARDDFVFREQLLHRYMGLTFKDAPLSWCTSPAFASSNKDTAASKMYPRYLHGPLLSLA